MIVFVSCIPSWNRMNPGFLFSRVALICRLTSSSGSLFVETPIPGMMLLGDPSCLACLWISALKSGVVDW